MSMVTTEATDMAMMPAGPSAHGSAAPGNPAKNRAIPATPLALAPANPIGIAAAQG